VSVLVGVLEKVRFQVLLLVVGSLFVLLSVYRVDDVTTLRLVRLPGTVYPVLVIGTVLIAAALLTAVLQRLPDGRDRFPTGRAVVSRDRDSVGIAIGGNVLQVRLGRIETAVTNPSASLVVLPANEYFDDQCVNDARSALGAFVQTVFPGRAPEFERAVAEKLRDLPRQSVGNASGAPRHAYPLGTAAYLDRPLGESFRLLVAAATTHRPGEGLRADPAALFTIVRAAQHVARDNRLAEIYLPLIGSGHGALQPSYALLVQLLAWYEICYANAGERRRVTIVVFRANQASEPDLSLDDVARLMRVAATVCEPRSRQTSVHSE